MRRQLRFGISIISVVLTVAALEGLLRLENYPLNLVPTVYDETVGILNWPDYRGCYSKEGDSCYAINSAGWRDVEHSLAKPPGTFRIAVIGDSYVEALQVPLERTFWKVLEERLRDAGMKAEVLGFGMSGFDLAQAFETLTHRVTPYDPDLVIATFFPPNDLRDTVRTLHEVPWKPYYTINDQGDLIRDDSFKDFVRSTNRFPRLLYRRLRNGSMVLSVIDLGMKQLFARGTDAADTSVDERIYRQPGTRRPV